MTTARRTQRERRDLAEAALLNAAAELAVEHGVRSLTLARVGERAGYSRGIVTHHFGSKQALLERLARATQTGFVPGLAGLPPGLDRLLRRPARRRPSRNRGRHHPPRRIPRRGRGRGRRATPRHRAAAAARPAGRRHRTAAPHRHRALAPRTERPPDLTPGHCAKRTDGTGS